MQKWMVKAFIQGVLSRMPGGTWLNSYSQSHITRRRVIASSKLTPRIVWANAHLTNYRTHSSTTVQNPRVIELGTGWFPTVPIVLSLCGADEVHTVDIVDLISKEYFYSMLNEFARLQIEDLVELAPSIDPDRFSHLQRLVSTGHKRPVDETLEHLRIRRVIGDASHLNIDDDYFDLVVSNTTLEHIPDFVLRQLFREFYRVCHAGAVSSHLIDMNDHYSYFDRSITVYNFLRYSSNQWKWFNNRLQYQNRLRLPDYWEIVNDAGFNIIEESANRKSAHQIEQVPVHKEFSKYKHEDLVAHSVWQVSVPNKT